MGKIATSLDIGTKTGNGSVSSLLGPDDYCPVYMSIVNFSDMLGYNVSGSYEQYQLVQLDDINVNIVDTNQNIIFGSYYMTTGTTPQYAVMPEKTEVKVDYGDGVTTIKTFTPPYERTNYGPFVETNKLLNASKLTVSITTYWGQLPYGFTATSGSISSSSYIRILNNVASSYTKNFPYTNFTISGIAGEQKPVTVSVDFTSNLSEIQGWAFGASLYLEGSLSITD